MLCLPSDSAIQKLLHYIDSQDFGFSFRQQVKSLLYFDDLLGDAQKLIVQYANRRFMILFCGN